MQQPQTQPGQRPLGIAILAGLIGCVAVAGFSMAVVAFGKGASPLVELVVSMLVCLLFLAFAVGAWTLRRWAWYLGVALMVWVLSAPIIDLVNGEMTSLQALRLVTLALILVYLFTPRVKAAFGQGQPGIAN